jgi:hypothetical protein
VTARRCSATTRAGEPCRAAPLKGRETCSAHDPLSPGSTRFGCPAQAREAGVQGGRPRVPRSTELQRRLVEEHAGAVVRPYFRALGLDVDEDGNVTRLERGAIVVARDKEGNVHASDVEDLAAQITAAEHLLNRVYGKPRQQLEHTGPDGGPIEVKDAAGVDLRRLSDDDLKELEGLLRRASTEPVPWSPDDDT